MIWNQLSCVLVSGSSESFLDALYDDASKIGSSGCVSEVFRKLIDELVAPICSRVAEVQVARCFELNVFRVGIRSSAVTVVPN
jgi:hypothetical protein